MSRFTRNFTTTSTKGRTECEWGGVSHSDSVSLLSVSLSSLDDLDVFRYFFAFDSFLGLGEGEVTDRWSFSSSSSSNSTLTLATSALSFLGFSAWSERELQSSGEHLNLNSLSHPLWMWQFCPDSWADLYCETFSLVSPSTGLTFPSFSPSDPHCCHAVSSPFCKKEAKLAAAQQPLS